MIAAFLIAGIGVLVLALVVAVARDPGPEPADVAIGFETAWDRLDFDAIWTLSAPALRDGLDRREFVSAKRDAYRDQAERGLVQHIGAEQVVATRDEARVRTRLDLSDGATVRHDFRMRRRSGRWEVVEYALSGDSPVA